MGAGWALLVPFLGASVAAGLTGVIFKPGAWYEGLVKPDWRPKNWMFPVAWTLIYLLSSLAAARVAALPGNGLALGLWSMQIALNTLWSPTFFGARRMGLAMAVMLALCATLLAMLWVFFTLDIWACALLLPYAGWLALAAPLNWRVWRDNRDAGHANAEKSSQGG